jgi:biotin carboxyl carrier protein
VGLQRLGESQRYLLSLDDQLIEVLVESEAQSFNVTIAGRSYEVETGRRRRSRGDEGDRFVDGRWLLRAPLTGVVQEVRAAAGQTVAAGDVLLVVEAMKMLNELRARVGGRLAAVHPGEGQRVEIGDILAEITEA